MSLVLYIGNQRYSSWSLRPWICLKMAGLPFETKLLRFDEPESFASLVPSPTKKVPALVDGSQVLYESLAICEYVNELAPEAGLWPDARAARADARCLAAEMQAGFGALRNECSMDVSRHEEPGAWPLSPRAKADVARISAIFEGAAERGGPFLLGRFGVVDAMYAPVVSRVLSYSLPVSEKAMEYVRTVRALPAMDEWYAAGEEERIRGFRHYFGSSRAPRDHEDALDFALRWAEAWNRRDVPAVTDHYAENAVFISPKAASIVGSPVVTGKSSISAYWTRGAELLPTDMRFEIASVALAGETLTIQYLRHAGDRHEHACEIVTFDPRTGLILKGEAYYGA